MVGRGNAPVSQLTLLPFQRRKRVGSLGLMTDHPSISRDNALFCLNIYYPAMSNNGDNNGIAIKALFFLAAHLHVLDMRISPGITWDPLTLILLSHRLDFPVDTQLGLPSAKQCWRWNHIFHRISNVSNLQKNEEKGRTRLPLFLPLVLLFLSVFQIEVPCPSINSDTESVPSGGKTSITFLTSK